MLGCPAGFFIRTHVCQFLVAALCATGAPFAHATTQIPQVKCEIEMSRRAHVVFKLLFDGLWLGDLDVDDLDQLARSASWYNPYTEKPRSELTLALGRGFSLVSRNLTESERGLVRKALAALVIEKKIEQSAVKAVSDATRQILAPKILYQVNNGEALIAKSPLGSGTFEGRPVFYGRFKKASAPGDVEIFFDPFHEDANLRTRVFRDEIQERSIDNIRIFDFQGKTYLAALRVGFYYEVKSGKDVTENFLGFHLASIMVQSKLYFREPNVIREKDFSQPNLQGKIIAHGKFESLTSHRVNGRDFVVALSTELATAKVFEVIDGEAHFLKDLDVKEAINAKLEMFLDRERIFLAYRSKLSALRARIVTVDLESGDRRETQNGYKIGVVFRAVDIEGVPHICTFESEDIVCVNTRTMKESEHTPTGGSDTNFNIFHWQGEPYGIWNQDGAMVIYNLISGSIHGRLRFSYNVFQVVPFVYQNRTYAFVATRSGLPYVVLISTESIR